MNSEEKALHEIMEGFHDEDKKKKKKGTLVIISSGKKKKGDNPLEELMELLSGKS